MSEIHMVTQVYPPDPAAVGQYFEDVAIEMANRGHRVTVYTADRDYDAPSIRYDARSRHPNVKVVRLPYTSFGKRNILVRLLGQFSYLFQASLRLLFARNVDRVLITTIPATTGVFFLFLRVLRPLKFAYWVMDINPDQAIALGAFPKGHPAARFLAWCNRKLVRSAESVVCLDSDMANRLRAADENPAGLPPVEILPPWPLEKDLAAVPRDENPFVKKQGWDKRLVFMYSGNHSMVHPLKTLLDAIGQLKDTERQMSFAFIGGGRGKAQVHDYMNRWSECDPDSDRVTICEGFVEVRSMPYQPLDQMRYSLSAGDVQVVSFGSEMVGIVHPSKFYGALALAKPVLLLGPKESALGRLVLSERLGWVVEHGDVNGMLAAISEICQMSGADRIAIGERGRRLIDSRFSRDVLCGRFCETVLEGVE